MLWKTPSFREVKMDAEIGSYSDFDLPSDRFVRTAPPGRRCRRTGPVAARPANATLPAPAGRVGFAVSRLHRRIAVPPQRTERTLQAVDSESALRKLDGSFTDAANP
jgi:hypothetical protein